MAITLIRHGRPLADFSTRRRGSELAEWLRAYESVAVDASLPPPESLQAALRGARRFSSPTPRARSSAALLAADVMVSVQVIDEAREAPLPERVRCPLRVRPRTLLALARGAWFLGAAATERPAAVRVRARRAAVVLLDAARETGEARSVALVGHGYMNRFIATELHTLGCRCVMMDGMGYWGAMRF